MNEMMHFVFDIVIWAGKFIFGVILLWFAKFIL